MRTEFLVGLILAVASLAGAAAPELEVRIPDGDVQLGDRLAVEVAARGESDLMWGELTVAVPSEGEWAVVEGPAERAGAVPPVWTVTLVPLAVGELDLPRFSVGARDAKGTVTDVAAVGRAITVASVLAEDDPLEPAELKPPVGVSGFPWEWLVPALVVILPMAAGALWWRSRIGAAALASGPVLTPLEELQLAVREAEAAVGREAAEGVCDRLAFGVRRYVERRTGEPGLEMTSLELVTMARRSGWPTTVQHRLQRVTGVADEVRFAHRHRADEELREAARSILELARELEIHLCPAEDQEQPS